MRKRQREKGSEKKGVRKRKREKGREKKEERKRKLEKGREKKEESTSRAKLKYCYPRRTITNVERTFQESP